MGCSVNHAQLSQIEKVLGAIISKGWLGELAQRISAAGMKLVADEFKTETDPYGKPWAPLKRERTRDRRARLRAVAAGRKVKGQKILQKSGRMKNSVGAAPRGFTARLTIPTWYAAVHQNGAHIAPHSRLASAQHFLVTGKKWSFISAKQAQQHARLGSAALAKRGWAYVRTKMLTRTYANGITIPQRMMLPNGDLPDRWQRVFEKESNLLLAQKMEVK